MEKFIRVEAKEEIGDEVIEMLSEHYNVYLNRQGHERGFGEVSTYKVKEE